MLEFWKDGKRFELEAVYGKAEVGDLLIYGQNVNWGNASPESHPLSQYEAPALFTVVDKEPAYYTLRDTNGKCIKANIVRDSCYLFNAQEWLNWTKFCQTEKFARKQRKIEQLEGHIDLLKDILIKQGSRIISDSQAQKLNIE